MGALVSTIAFPRPVMPKPWYEQGLLAREDLVWLETSAREKIPACHVKPAVVSGKTRKTILYSHGNAEDLGLHLSYIDALANELEVDVFSYEYVGYSLSRFEPGEPSPSEEGCIRSIDAAWKYLTVDLGLAPSSIVIFGRSIGSGPSVDLASREVAECPASPLDAAGVLLQSPIESGARVAFGDAVSRLGYYMDIFRNYEKIGKIRAPVAIMHGTADKVVDVRNGENLAGMVRNKFEPYWITGYGHNDMPHNRCMAYAKKFLEHLEPKR